MSFWGSLFDYSAPPYRERADEGERLKQQQAAILCPPAQSSTGGTYRIWTTGGSDGALWYPRATERDEPSVLDCLLEAGGSYGAT